MLVCSAWAPSTAASSSFIRTDYPSGNAYPNVVTVADFNGDGKPDLAVSHKYGSIGVSLNHGDGTFATAVHYSVGADLNSVTAADFNGDGKIDLATSFPLNPSDGGPGGFAVLMGNGDGTFQSAVNYPGLGSTTSIASADFSGDGKPDVAVGTTAVFGPGGVSMMLNNGNGTFTAGGGYSAGASPSFLHQADVNADSKPDLVVANAGASFLGLGGSVSILLNNGNGTFPAPINYASSDSSNGITTGDFNHDSNLDIAVSQYEAGSLLLFTGNGDGTFSPGGEVSTSGSPYAVCSADFDGDGNVDLAASTTEAVVSVLHGNGDGTFGSALDFETDLEPNGITTSDLNLDSKADLVTTNANQAFTLSILLNGVAPPPPATASQWIQTSPGGAPTRYLGSGAYDPSSNRLIAFGGQGGLCLGNCSATNDVMVLTYANGLGGTPLWNQLATIGTPPPERFSAIAGYDVTTNRLIVTGGVGPSGMQFDTWVLTNANGVGGQPEWIQIAAGGGPGRYLASGVYDPIENRLIVFGGMSGLCLGFCSSHNDVWVLTNANGLGGIPMWNQLSTVGTPPPERFSGITAYDAASKRLILTCGVGPSGFQTDAWVLTNANGVGGNSEWVQISAAGGPARYLGSGVYDPATNRLLVYGGQAGPSMSLGFAAGNNDVWALSNANALGGPAHWNKVITAGGPPFGRFGGFSHLVGYDAANNRLIAKGGVGRNGFINDTWVLTNANGAGQNQFPVAICDNVTVQAGTAGTAAASIDGGSFDPDSGDSITLSQSPPGPYPVGTTSVTLTVTDSYGNSSQCSAMVTVEAPQLTALGATQVWIGLKNSDDVGTKFDLLAEVLKNGSVVGSGQINSVPGGSSGFNNAVLRTINLALASPVDVGPGDTLSIRLSVRIAVGVSGHRSGTARLWFNDAAANSRFNATIGATTSDYLLRDGFVLAGAAGPGPKKTVDVLVDRAVGGNPFKPFGTWSRTF
jgi:hypothetical protein